MSSSDDQTAKVPVLFNPKSGFEFADLDGMFRVALCYLQSGFAPDSFKTPQQLVICWARGAELGLKPLQAVEGLTVINNRIGIMGDVALGLVRSSGLLEDEPEVEYTGKDQTLACSVSVKRKGAKKPRSASFSWQEAKDAGLIDRPAPRGIPPWKAYPRRMVYYRALGFVLRDTFSDVLKGMPLTEELNDIPSFADTEAEKIANARAREAEIAQTVPVSGIDQPRATPEEEVKDAFEDEARPTSFAEQLKKDYPEVPVKQTAPPNQPEQPDDIDLSFDPRPKQQAAPPVSAEQARPAWMDHVIKSIPQEGFLGKKISELDLKALGRIERQWIPAVEKGFNDASPEQQEELPLFKAAVAHSKVAKLF
jgi:hypothetical protein